MTMKGHNLVTICGFLEATDIDGLWEVRSLFDITEYDFIDACNTFRNKLCSDLVCVFACTSRVEFLRYAVTGCREFNPNALYFAAKNRDTASLQYLITLDRIQSAPLYTKYEALASAACLNNVTSMSLIESIIADDKKVQCLMGALIVAIESHAADVIDCFIDMCFQCDANVSAMVISTGDTTLFMRLLPQFDLGHAEILSQCQFYERVDLASLYVNHYQIMPTSNVLANSFVAACRRDLYDFVHYYLAYGVPADAFECQGLRYSVRSNNVEITKLLLDYGVAKNKLSSAAFNVACGTNHVVIVSLFLRDPYFEPTSFAFITACEFGALDVVKELVRDGRIQVRADNDEAFVKACENNCASVVQFLLGLLNRFHNTNAFSVGLEIAMRHGYESIVDVMTRYEVYQTV